jgi:hypothetical protein
MVRLFFLILILESPHDEGIYLENSSDLFEDDQASESDKERLMKT